MLGSVVCGTLLVCVWVLHLLSFAVGVFLLVLRCLVLGFVALACLVGCLFWVACAGLLCLTYDDDLVLDCDCLGVGLVGCFGLVARWLL